MSRAAGWCKEAAGQLRLVVSEQGELLRPGEGEPLRFGDLGGSRWRRARRGRAFARAQGAVTKAGPRPANPVLFCQLADLAGDPGLVRLGCVGSLAVQLQVAVDQFGVLGP